MLRTSQAQKRIHDEKMRDQDTLIEYLSRLLGRYNEYLLVTGEQYTEVAAKTYLEYALRVVRGQGRHTRVLAEVSKSEGNTMR